MRVAVFNGADRPITIERFDDPEVGADEVRIQIARCGICGSDISMTAGSAFDYPTGCRLGHEFAGEVVEIGRSVSAPRVGDKVAVLPKCGCGHCPACEVGHTFFCPIGPPVFGGFGDMIVAHASAAFALPQSISMADGALVEPMACGLRALRMAGMRGGERVMVIGAGTVALSVIYWARRLGAGPILVASRSARRHDVAMAMGASAVHRFDEDDPGDIEAALGGPPDIIAECVGKPGMLQKAIAFAPWRGTVLSMGMCTVNDAVLPAQCTFKELRLLFPLGYTIGEFTETIDAFEADAVRPELMVSDVIGLDALPATIEAMRGPHSHLKVHVNPQLEANYA
jgi:(R,R)-butanediol dehydrogenase/meso-butanediol dehydrogenase/diacetyl reductase